MPLPTTRHPVPAPYLVLGHLAQDVQADESRLGGTVAYAALTAHALGYAPHIVSAHTPDLDLTPLAKIPITRIESPVNTTFENIYNPGEGRTQFVRARAETLHHDHIPAECLTAPLVHLAPIAGELDPTILDGFEQSLIGLTPQGWLRTWDGDGRVRRAEWTEALKVIPRVNATVISIEDVEGDWALARLWGEKAEVLVVTEGARGCTVFARNKTPWHFSAPLQRGVDPTGAGDIFATAFFISLYETHNPWTSARFANEVAARSVTRIGLAGAPTLDEVAQCRKIANIKQPEKRQVQYTI